ncbi:hypothetical protein EDD21DRAFT_185690 [Dissophora ornata]|nr:hypothetical protein BGZ58_011317 [Dissophora ornata]KAI8598475.1 hypothetical protein EDD21DRAFT_185690 [Dissophora ornata]
MKFISSILMISAAIATVATAAPLASRESITNANIPSNLSKRCTGCTHEDGVARDLFVSASANLYAGIARDRLDLLKLKIEAAKVPSGVEALPREAMLMVTVKSTIDKAKQDCTSEALAPVIMETIAEDPSMDFTWSNKKEVEKRMTDINAKITDIVIKRLQFNVNAVTLSKDCTEKMTNTEIAPAPAPEASAPIPETPAPAPETPAPAPETPAPAPEAPAPAPESPAPVPESPAPGLETAAAVPESTTEPNVEDKNGLQVGINIAGDFDPKFVCKSGCQNSQDAETVLGARVSLQNFFANHLDPFYNNDVPTDCAERHNELLGSLFGLIGINLHIGI